MGLLDGLERLITEHGSAAILRERIQLANDKHAEIERRLKASDAENFSLKASTKLLEAQLQAARSEIDEIRRLQREADEKRNQQVSVADSMPTERVSVLRTVCFNPDLTARQIAGMTSIIEQTAEWHLDVLRKANMVDIQVTSGSDWTGDQGSTTYNIRPEGRAYLAERGLLST